MIPSINVVERFSALASLQKGWTIEGDYKISSDLQYAKNADWDIFNGYE